MSYSPTTLDIKVIKEVFNAQTILASNWPYSPPDNIPMRIRKTKVKVHWKGDCVIAEPEQPRTYLETTIAELHKDGLYEDMYNILNSIQRGRGKLASMATWNGVEHTDSKTANLLFRDYWRTLYTDNTIPNKPLPRYNEVDRECPEFTGPDLDIVVSKLAVGKAIGLDGVPDYIIKRGF